MRRANGSITLAELLELDRTSAAPGSLTDVVGDGYLFRNNDVFRRVRQAAREAGFRYTKADPGGYFGFPLAALETVLRSRSIPYRPTRPALVALERSRPGFFALSDLRLNRPTPNYLLHESAHAVAFDALFGRPPNVRTALADPARLIDVQLGEAFAMTAEYLAACWVSGTAHAWFFSIHSYRHRVPQKKAVGEIIEELGLEAVARLLCGAFLYNVFLVERLDRGALARLLEFAELEPIGRRTALERKLRSSLNRLMVMSPEFRRDTTRLFLASLGYSRNVERVLAADPFVLAQKDPGFGGRFFGLMRVLTGAPSRPRSIGRHWASSGPTS